MNIPREEAYKLQKEGRAQLYKSIKEAFKNKYFTKTTCKRINLPVEDSERSNVYALSRNLASYTRGNESYVEVFYRDVEIVEVKGCTFKVHVGGKVYSMRF